MRTVKNRLAPAPGQAKGRVVSKSRWSAGKRKANGVVKRTLRLANAVKKKRCASVTTRCCVAGNRLVDGLAGKRDAGGSGEMRSPDANGATRGLESPPYGMTVHAAPAGSTPNRFSAWGKRLGCLVWRQTQQPNPGQGPVFPKKRGFCCFGCGQATAYPQDRMCRTTFTEDNSFFLQHPCKLDTIFVQLVCDEVNR
jgi:hypothetical protein